MKKAKKWILSILTILILIVVCAFGFFVIKIAPIGSAYKAKRVCSCVFLAGRNPDQVIREDVAGLEYIGVDIDNAEKSVTGSFLGMAKRTAIYRDGLGCTLVLGKSAEELKKQASGYKPMPVQDRSKIPWPDGDLVPDVPLPSNVSRRLLENTLKWAFSPGSIESPIMARAVVVVYDGRIVAEQYDEGFDMNTPQLGWSMSKSATNALAGILVKKGKLSLNGPCTCFRMAEAGRSTFSNHPGSAHEDEQRSQIRRGLCLAVIRCHTDAFQQRLRRLLCIVNAP